MLNCVALWKTEFSVKVYKTFSKQNVYNCSEPLGFKNYYIRRKTKLSTISLIYEFTCV